MERARPPILVLALLVLALGVAACGDKAPAGGGGGSGPGIEDGPEGGDSPQALMERARPLAEKNDWGRLVRLVAPEDRPVMAFMGVFLAQMAVQFAPDETAKAEAQAKLDTLKGALDEVLARHGVDLGKVDPTKVQGLMGRGDPDVDEVRAFFAQNFPSVEPGPFLTDVFATMDEHGDGRQTMSLSKGFTGELKDVKIEGDRARGTADGKDMVFVKVNGRWFISLAEMMKSNKANRGGPK
jgi:hypothetical protein